MFKQPEFDDQTHIPSSCSPLCFSVSVWFYPPPQTIGSPRCPTLCAFSDNAQPHMTECFLELEGPGRNQYSFVYG